MPTNQQYIQTFVRRDIAHLARGYAAGPWLTEEAAAQFEASVEHEAVAYIEERALTEAVGSVIGAENPATPFIVLGLKQVLDAETPAAVRFAHEHPGMSLVGVCAALVCLVWFTD